jgi:dynein heavy chain
MWRDQGRSYPSLKPLAGYVADLLLRLEFFEQWLTDKPPAVYWISSFFFTQAFLTGSKQNFARKFSIPIDHLSFEEDFMKADSSALAAPENGVLAHGLFLEGARWDTVDWSLAESLPKILFCATPVIWFKPCPKVHMSSFPHYECPLYKTADRRGVLSTTGHSTNFVCFLRLPTSLPGSHWVQRGVALLSQLND